MVSCMNANREEDNGHASQVSHTIEWHIGYWHNQRRERYEIVIRLEGKEKRTTNVSASGDRTEFELYPYAYNDDTVVFSLPGTDLLETAQRAANFSGDTCLFPAAKRTMGYLCTAFGAGLRRNKDGSLVLHRQSNVRGSSNTTRVNYSALVLAGHSLGAIAVQHISVEPPASCEPGNGHTFAFEGYAFASPGLVHPAQEAERSQQSELVSYVSECDWLLRSDCFGERRQAGKLVVGASVDDHTIDNIQKHLHCCNQGSCGLVRPSSVNIRQTNAVRASSCPWNFRALLSNILCKGERSHASEATE